MSAIAPEVFLSMGLSEAEFDSVCRLLGRDPTYTELGMFAVMWSEHCGYKYSRPILSYFRRYKEALDGSGFENAGIVDIGDGLGITMKVESHNHPSAVEPYQGAATGVGGIIRDIFTMGARPVASLNSLRFGTIVPGKEPEPVVQRNHYLFKRVVEGIAGYGNCVGVPTVAGEVAFHPRYSGNPLVNAMAVGVVGLDSIATAAAQGEGNSVIYLGSATGKDGIHGATFASDLLGADNDAKRPNVQIGDPFAEKLLIEATLEALRTGAVQSIQDMGAAGLTCSTVEMSSKGGVGMDIDLDLVPMREDDMSAYELMLSESQERMLAVAHPGREREIIEVFHKWGVHAVVIGKVTSDGIVRVRRRGVVEAEAPAKLLTDHCPTYSMESRVPEYHEKARAFSLDSVPVLDLPNSLLALLATPDLASKQWVFEQYDQQVQTQTAVLPGRGDAAVMALRGTQKGIALKTDGNARHVYLDPYVGGQLAVVEAARNVACTGAIPKAITDGLNFGNPEEPHVYWQFERAVKGIADAAEAMGTPVISGNVSFYNQSDLGEVLPTPIIGMLGVLPHADRRLELGFPAGFGLVGLVGYQRDAVPCEGLGGSAYLAELHGIEDGLPVPPVLSSERALCEFLSAASDLGWLDCAHDLSEGGVAVALAEMCIANRVGVSVDLTHGSAFRGLRRADAKWFGEFPGNVLVGYQARCEQDLAELAARMGLVFERLGDYGQGAPTLTIDGTSVGIDSLSERYMQSIPRAMAE